MLVGPMIRRADSRARQWSHSFLLVHAMELNAITFYARTAEDKKKWMEAVREALASVAPVQRISSCHDPAMHTFDKPVNCQVSKCTCYNAKEGRRY